MVSGKWGWLCVLKKSAMAGRALCGMSFSLNEVQLAFEGMDAPLKANEQLSPSKTVMMWAGHNLHHRQGFAFCPRVLHQRPRRLQRPRRFGGDSKSQVLFKTSGLADLTMHA